MSDEKHIQDLMRYLDGEMSEEERRAFRAEIEKDPERMRELRQLTQICNLAEEVTFAEPDREVWDRYWKGVTARTQRGAGWSLSGLGLAILAGSALTYFFTSPAVPGPIKWGFAMLLAGLAILFFTVLVARLKSMHLDKYRGVER